jgi:hypothetical protein
VENKLPKVGLPQKMVVSLPPFLENNALIPRDSAKMCIFVGEMVVMLPPN